MAKTDLMIGVLGPVHVIRDGEDATPRGILQRRLLAALTLRANQIVTADALCDALWPERLPADHHAALHTHMFRLRRTLPDDVIARVGSGYRLTVERGAVDANRFEDAVAQAASERARSPADAAARLADALGWWRGTPYEELGDIADASIEAERLTELCRRAAEERFETFLQRGLHRDVMADLDSHAAHNALRERPQSQLMTALHRDGRIADALAVFDRYRRALAEQLGIEPSAAIRRQHDQIIVGVDDVAAEPEPEPGRGPNAGVTPHQSSTFVGRQALVGSLLEMLAGHRLVTLLGPGGVGKTRLAHEVSALVGDGYPDGVWFCALAAAGADSVALTVAMTLDIEQRSGADPALRVAEVLRGQRALIILDNCEHVIDAAAALAETIVATAPRVSVIATSRERLRIGGEQLCPVPPLPLPPLPLPPLPLQRGLESDQPAVRLFIDRAVAVRPGWQPDEDERSLIATICRRLDGLPLAIELAAARLHTLTLAEIAAGLDDRLRLLTLGRRTSGRHGSLFAAISWSYELLDPREQELLDAVSIFQGPFTAAAAGAVADCPTSQAVELLSGLVERSLAQRAGGRYAVLESLRAFGIDRLVSRGGLTGVQRNHAWYYARFIDEANARLRRAREVGVLDDIDLSIGDLRVAFRYLMDTGEFDRLLDLAIGLHDYGLYRMRPEALGWAEQVAIAAEAAGWADLRVADAFALGAVGAWKRGDLAHTGELIDRAASAMRSCNRVGVRHHVGETLRLQALIQGRLDELIDHPPAEMEGDPARNDPMRIAEHDGVTLLARGYRGDPETAEIAAALIDQLTDETSVLQSAWICYVAGEAVLDIDPALATRRLHRAVALARQCGSSFILGVAGSSYASLLARHGDAPTAIQEYRWLLDQWRRAGVRSLQWTTLRSVTELLTRLEADRPAAVLLGSVTSSEGGHEIFGEDVGRLTALSETLRSRLGAKEFESALAEGATLDDNDAAASALRAFDQWADAPTA